MSTPSDNIAGQMLRALVGIFRRMSLGTAVGIGEFLGLVAYVLMRRKNAIGMRNLDLVYGDTKSRRWKKAVLRRMWVNFGRNLAEFLRIADYGPHNIDEYVTWTGFHHLEESRAKGRGSLVLTAHYGNWDLLALAAGINGIPVAMITKRLKNPFWNDFWMEHRLGGGGEWVFPIWKKGAAKGIFRALRQNLFVAYVLDQDTKRKENPIFVEFFGRKASTTDSLAVISFKRKIPVIPAFVIRKSRSRHHVHVLEPIEFQDAGTLEESVAATTRKYLEVLEKFILARPDHWIWIHRRWKRVPGGGLSDIYDGI